MPVAYVDYKTLDDEFYTLKRVCHCSNSTS